MSTRPPTPYAIGQLVRLVDSGERAVVVDIDFTYQPDEDWPDELAAELESATLEGEGDDRPWVRLLVDGGAEAYLRDDRVEPDDQQRPIQHPRLEHLFDLFVDGYYARTRGLS